MRFNGIDVPERSQICTDAADKQFLFGGCSADELDAILERNPIVTCREKYRDRYGRIVATCFLDGADILAELVRCGLALDYPRYSRGRYERDEEAARDACAGLWAGDCEIPWKWQAKWRVR